MWLLLKRPKYFLFLEELQRVFAPLQAFFFPFDNLGLELLLGEVRVCNQVVVDADVLGTLLKSIVLYSLRTISHRQFVVVLRSPMSISVHAHRVVNF